MATPARREDPMVMSALIVALAPSPSPGPTVAASGFLDMSASYWTGWAAIGTIAGALATAVAVVVSLFTVMHQRARENDLRESEETRQRRSQADYISGWYHYGKAAIFVANQSTQAIYDVYAVLVRHSSDGEGHTTDFAGMLRIIPPGKQGHVPIPHGWGGMHFIPGATITFRDAQGITWQRTNQGRLKELDKDVFEHYGLSHPMGYVDDAHQGWG